MLSYRCHLAALFAALTVFFVCGCSSSTGGPSVAVGMSMQAVNYSVTHSLGAETHSVTATNTNNVGDSGIWSTAPQQMIVYLQSISVTPTSTGSSQQQATTVWTSSVVGGTPITLSSGSVDLNSLGLGTISIPSGTYSTLTLTFARVAQIQGCVKGSFGTGTLAHANTATTDPATNNTVHSDSLADFSGFADGTAYTFCTRSDESMLKNEPYTDDQIGTLASFLSTNGHFSSGSPDLVQIDLAASETSTDTTASIESGTISIASGAAFTVSSSSVPSLAIAVDLNRMLRFETNTTANGGSFSDEPNPGMPAGTSYFFSTVFAPTGSSSATAAIHVFAGDLGSVQGYQMWVTQTGGGSMQPVYGWMTAFLDSSGNFLSANVMPDDDNTLTIIKGNATPSTTALTPFTSGLTLTLGISNTTFDFLGLSTVSTTPATPIALDWGNASSQSDTYTLTYERLL